MKELLIATSMFESLCAGLQKVSFIRKMPKGYWGVFSHKGKLLGKYKTKELAVKRLKQIEFFKHKNASTEKEEPTYSALMRDLGKKYDQDILRKFRETFKEAFDQALLSGDEDPEKTALNTAIDFVNELDENLSKVASAIQMGDPEYAGKYISEIIKFLCRRIDKDNRKKSLNNLKKKLYLLNEFDLSKKKMPASASLGQAISLTKNLLMMHPPSYVRAVLNSIVKYL